MRLIFMRHGESEANILNVFSNIGYKHGLTETGRIQAAENARLLMDKAINPKYIFSSPLKRAVETAEIVCKILGKEFCISKELTEFSVGDYEGRSDKEGWDEFTRLWDEWFLKGNSYYCMGGGENLNQIIDRMKVFLLALECQYPEETTILLISHGGTVKSVISSIVNNLPRKELRDVWLTHSDYVEIEYKTFGQAVCKKYGNYSQKNTQV